MSFNVSMSIGMPDKEVVMCLVSMVMVGGLDEGEWPQNEEQKSMDDGCKPRLVFATRCHLDECMECSSVQ